MSINQRNVIDFIGNGKADGSCTLFISDHLPWNDPEHIPKLRNKLNDYMSCIKSGEIYEMRPDAKGRRIEIQVICKYFPPQGDGVSFMELASEAIRSEGVHFLVTPLEDSQTKAKPWWQFWK